MDYKTPIIGMSGGAGSIVIGQQINIWLGVFTGVVALAFLLRRWYVFEKERTDNDKSSNST